MEERERQMHKSWDFCYRYVKTTGQFQTDDMTRSWVGNISIVAVERRG